MSGCILHVGMHKTGSSSIQKSLFRYLDDPDYYYVNLGLPNASQKIATAFKKQPERYHAHKKKGTTPEQLQRARDETIQKLESELQRASNRTVILSGEDIPNLGKDEFRSLCDFIAAAKRNVKAVGYIRPPKSYMESAFQQRVKGRLDRFDIYGLYPNYRKRFEKLEMVLGMENVLFWCFDPKSFPSGCVVQDFCNRLDINFSPDKVIRANESLSQPALSLLYTYKKLGPGSDAREKDIQEIHFLAKHVKQLPGPKLRFHSTLLEPILDKNREDIAWMEDRLGCSLTEKLTADDEFGIRSEEDLLTYAPETTKWLASQLGPEYENRWHDDMTAQDVAGWMHALRFKLLGGHEYQQSGAAKPKRLASRSPTKPTGKNLSAKVLVQDIRQSMPELRETPEEEAVELLREVFHQISQLVDTSEERRVILDGFGKFRIRRDKHEKNSNSDNTKVVLFEPAKTIDGA